jgi:hypothetical protein
MASSSLSRLLEHTSHIALLNVEVAFVDINVITWATDLGLLWKDRELAWLAASLRALAFLLFEGGELGTWLSC